MAQKEPLLQDDCPVEECALQSPDVEHRVDLGDVVDPARNKDSARDTFRGTASDEGGLDTRNWAGIYILFPWVLMSRFETFKFSAARESRDGTPEVDVAHFRPYAHVELENNRHRAEDSNGSPHAPASHFCAGLSVVCPPQGVPEP
jgi:hypothetical protein